MELDEGTVSLVRVADITAQGDAGAIEVALRHPEDIFCGDALTKLVMQGNDKVRDALFSRMDEEACLDLVLDLAFGRYDQATEAVIRHADNPKCWEALQAYKDYGPECRERILKLL